jgi:multidrug efflux pump subunit AcrB
MSDGHAKSDLENRHNIARFFTENRSIAFVALILCLVWGAYSYWSMPRLKDPVIPVRAASAVTAWPGMDAISVDRLVTRAIEATIAESSLIQPPGPETYGIKSMSLPGLSIVQIQLDQDVSDTKEVFNAINLRLQALSKSLPEGVQPIQFNDAFGETAALLLTIASPTESDLELEIRARDIKAAIEEARSESGTGSDTRFSVVVVLPRDVDPEVALRSMRLFSEYAVDTGDMTDPELLLGPGFVGVDGAFGGDASSVQALIDQFLNERLGQVRFHEDAWDAAIVAAPTKTLVALEAVRGSKYSYHQLDQFSEFIADGVLTVPLVSEAQRSGLVSQQVLLEYEQARLASYGVDPYRLSNILDARNTTTPAGSIRVGDVDVLIEASGSFDNARQIGGVIVTTNEEGSPLYLRDLVDVSLSYQNPPRLFDHYLQRDARGDWERLRAVNLAIDMHEGEKIGDFGSAVSARIDELKILLPDDLIIARSSDQPEQVAENLNLFTRALVEAMILVVIIAFVGFWEWRSAVLVMISIPITLMLTFGMIDVFGIKLQQVSIVSLIIALGLLVDDPVVANDAIKREMAAGKARLLAAWLGPTKLGKAIMFATLTNIVAYLPFLLLTGNTGDFLYSLPIVMSCALIASRLVSMTFVPMLGYVLLRPRRKPEKTIEERRVSGFGGLYCKVGSFAIENRKKVMVASFAILAAGAYFKSDLKTSFFPDDVEYLFFIDVFMRNGEDIIATDRTIAEIEQVITQVSEEYGKANPDEDGNPREIVVFMSDFIGGGAPRFWFSVTPQLNQTSYGQILVRVSDKDDTPKFILPLQEALTNAVPGAFIDVRQLQTNPVDYPVAMRLFSRSTLGTSDEITAYREMIRLAEEVAAIMRSSPLATRVRQDWGEEVFRVAMDIDVDRANLAGLTNQNIAASSGAGISGFGVGEMRVGEDQIPIVARMRLEDRARLSDLNSLYVYGDSPEIKVPLLELATLDYGMEIQRIRRLDHYPVVTIFAFPTGDHLPSEFYNTIADDMAAYAQTLPPGYELLVDGEQSKQTTGFMQLAITLLISMTLIYVALVVQFNSIIKPFLVFAAVPYGMVGALGGLWIMGSSFGFIALLGMIALMGVIVSHVIVLFDFIEERRDEGEDLKTALLDAGILRLRPVMITVGATVLALFPLAIEGGPLWQPLSYAQIGGLIVAMGVTLVLVPVFYAIFVLDLKIVAWDVPEPEGQKEPCAPEPA